MKHKPIIILPILLVTVLVAYLVYHYTNSGSSGTNDIRVSGNIEVTDAELSFKIAGRVEQRLVDEGMQVKKGQIVAQLDSRDLQSQVDVQKGELAAAQAALAALEAGSRPEEIAAARAAASQAQAQLQELLHGSRPQEIQAAEERVAAAKAEATRLEANHKRSKELFETQTISAQEYDQAKQAWQSAVARLKEAQEQYKLVKEGPRQENIEQARAALSEAKSKKELVEKGPRKEDIDQGRARVQQAQAALALAETRLNYATLVSPISGTVLSKNIEPGEYVSAGTPVITVANLEDVWVRAYVNETDLGKVKLGQKATVTTDTYPGKTYSGYVSFISSASEFTPKNIQTEEERVKLVYRVKINIRNVNQELKPGMPVDAVIQTSGQQGE